MTVIAARKGLFRPTSPILLADWDASTLGLTNGATVSTWPDSSGNGHDLVAGTTAPTYATGIQNGLGVVRFTGTQWLKYLGPNVDGSVPWLADFNLTIVLVYVRRGAVNNSTPMTFWNATQNNDFPTQGYSFIAGFEGGTASTIAGFRNRSGGSGPSVAHPGNNVAMLVTHVAQDPTNTITVNATTASQNTTSGSWRDIAVQNIYVGCRYDKSQNAVDGSCFFYNGDLCRASIYGGWMPSATLTAIQAARKSQWGTP